MTRLSSGDEVTSAHEKGEGAVSRALRYSTCWIARDYGQGSAVTVSGSVVTWPPGPWTNAQWPPSTAEMQYDMPVPPTFSGLAVTMPAEPEVERTMPES